MQRKQAGKGSDFSCIIRSEKRLGFSSDFSPKLSLQRKAKRQSKQNQYPAVIGEDMKICTTCVIRFNACSCPECGDSASTKRVDDKAYFDSTGDTIDRYKNHEPNTLSKLIAQAWQRVYEIAPLLRRFISKFFNRIFNGKLNKIILFRSPYRCRVKRYSQCCT